MPMALARTFTPHELATLTSAQVEALPPLDRQAFFLASAKATDPFYPFHLEGAGAGIPIPLPDLSVDRDLTRDLDPIASGRRFEIGE